MLTKNFHYNSPYITTAKVLKSTFIFRILKFKHWFFNYDLNIRSMFYFFYCLLFVFVSCMLFLHHKIKRANVLNQVAELLEKRSEAFVRAEIMDQGRAIQGASKEYNDVHREVHNIKHFTALAIAMTESATKTNGNELGFIRSSYQEWNFLSQLKFWEIKERNFHIYKAKCLKKRERTNNKLNPHMASTLGFPTRATLASAWGEFSHDCIQCQFKRILRGEKLVFANIERVAWNLPERKWELAWERIRFLDQLFCFWRKSLYRHRHNSRCQNSQLFRVYMGFTNRIYCRPVIVLKWSIFFLDRFCQLFVPLSFGGDRNYHFLGVTSTLGVVARHSSAGLW